MAVPIILPKETRFELAIKAKLDNPDLTLKELGYTYDVPYSTLKHRWNGRRPQKAYGESCDGLTPAKGLRLRLRLDYPSSRPTVVAPFQPI